ncbi:MAG: outer membrane beta-barrel protein [Bacteroidota bacterium]
MKKATTWLILFFSITLNHFSYSQKSDYIATDSTLRSGINLINSIPKDNARFIRLKKKDGNVTYNPNQLSEYGFRNGTVYVSKSIPVSGRSKQVFLERIASGKINLYYYRANGIRTFFLERDSTIFTEVEKGEEFRKVIAQYTNDLEWTADQVRLTKYNRKSLAKLIALYNKGLDKPMPFIRVGLIAGLNSTYLKTPSGISIERWKDVSFSPGSSFTFGIFGDLPIDMSNFSFNIGLHYAKSGFSSTLSDAQSDVDVIINYTSLSVPILVRYTLPNPGWRPFINAGGIYSHLLRNESIIYEFNFDQNTITTTKEATQLLNNHRPGLAIGLGIQRQLQRRKTTSVEFRLNHLPGNDNTLHQQHLEILTSFSF